MEIGIGDIYKLKNWDDYWLIMIKDIENINDAGKLTQKTDTWGNVEFYHDGVYVHTVSSIDCGQNWNHFKNKIPRKWVKILLERNHWELVLKNDIDFFEPLEINEK